MVPLPELKGKYLLIVNGNSRKCFLLFYKMLSIWIVTILCTEYSMSLLLCTENSPALLLGLVGHLIRDDILGTFGVLCR